MADLNLVFSRLRYTGGPIALVFGAEDAPPAPDPLTAHGTTALGGVSSAGLAVYNNLNPARISAASTRGHQTAQRGERTTKMPRRPAQRRLGGVDQPQQRADKAGIASAQPWTRPTKTVVGWAQVHERALGVVVAPAGVHQVAIKLRAQADQVHQIAAALQAMAVQPIEIAHLTHTGGVQAHQIAARFQALAYQLQQRARAAGRGLDQPWEQSRKPPPGKEVWPPVPTGPGFEPHVPDLNLVFACPPYQQGEPIALVFGRVCLPPVAPGALLYILPARYYMTVHNLQAHRLPDLTEIPIFDVSLSSVRGSFGWTFNASVGAGAFDALAPSGGLPAQIRITLDGIQFAFAVDSLQREEQFGRRSVRIAGRSVTSLLADPYSRETSRLNLSARTAQQLALEALEFTGVALDWGITDWLVPIGAWSHTGTPLAAVQTIVEAAGGYLHSHRTAATLLARHPYPDLAGGLTGGPWNWYAPSVVPDVELAPDAFLTTGIERRDGPDINAVYVSGTTQGVNVLYKRAGTAGEKLAQPVTDALITAAEVGRWRGRSIVGAGGPKHLVQGSIPVLIGESQPGVLDVGQLVQINETQPWRGRVHEVGVSARFGEKVRQVVSIERHLEVAP